jgi:serine protein kinase
LDDEIKIYEKLISRATDFQGIHIAPHTMRLAAMFAILSRLEEPKDQKFTLLTKMRLYNGEKIDGAGREDEKKLREIAEREGMDGISPRYVVNRISACFTKYGKTYITPMDIVRSIKEGFSTNAKLTKDDINRFENIITTVMEEYNKIATNEVQKAFFLNFEHEIKDLLNNYIDNVGAYLDDDKVKNEWGDLEEPNHRLMRSVEEKIGVTDGGKDAFRQEVYRKMIKSKSETGIYDYQSHPRLKEALQKQLFEERSDIIRLTVSVRNPDPEALKRLNEVIKTLSEQCGYTPESANDLLRYVSSIMAKNN